MKLLVQTLAVGGLVIATGSAAFSQAADPATMTCSQFSAMTPEDQKMAVDAMHSAQMDAAGTTGSDTTATAGSDTTSTAGSDTTGTTSSDTSATTSTDSTSTTGSDATAGASDADPAITALTEACSGHDDDLAMDHMMN